MSDSSTILAYLAGAAAALLPATVILTRTETDPTADAVTIPHEPDLQAGDDA